MIKKRAIIINLLCIIEIKINLSNKNMHKKYEKK